MSSSPANSSILLDDEDAPSSPPASESDQETSPPPSDSAVPRTPPRQKHDLPLNTPIARKLDGQKNSFLPNRAADNNRHHAREGRKVVIGPMPVIEFFKETLPPMPSGKEFPPTSGAFDNVPSQVSKEHEIYFPLVDAINEGEWCPGVQFCVTADKPEDLGRGAFKPDVMAFQRDDINRIVSKEVNGRLKYEANFGYSQLSVEIKPKRKDDPFSDDHVHVDSSGATASFFAYENHRTSKPGRQPDINDPGMAEYANFGQIVRYAAHQCSRQHRMFAFSISIIGTRARFFRWDRAGCLVTRSFDYKEQPELLCEFLWRFGHANFVQRGFDPTVAVASTKEEKFFKKLLTEHIILQLDINTDDKERLDEELKKHYEPGKVTKIFMFDAKRSTSDEYLVSVPLKSPVSAASQGTRAFWAVRLIGSDDGEVNFLKDMWRVDIEELVEPEGTIYDGLQEDEVLNVCDALAYEDVPYLDIFQESEQIAVRGSELHSGQSTAKEIEEVQTTLTDRFVDAPWVCDCLREKNKWQIVKRTHFRMVLKQAGYPLRTFTDTRELFEGGRDAMQALDSAYEKRKRLHRDVSIDNIILYRYRKGERRRGLLTDWEFSTLADREGKARDYFRSGTWAFMSISALTAVKDFRHAIQDDMESILYVMIYAAVRYLPHNDVRDLGRWMYEFFDASTESDGRDQGGAAKGLTAYTHGRVFLEMFGFKHPSVHEFFSESYAIFGQDNPNWTRKNFISVFLRACHSLSTTNSPYKVRTDHDVGDFFTQTAARTHGTLTSLRNELARMRESRQLFLRRFVKNRQAEQTNVDSTSQPTELPSLGTLSIEELDDDATDAQK